MQNGGFVNKIQGVRLSVAKIHRHVFENPGCKRRRTREIEVGDRGNDLGAMALAVASELFYGEMLGNMDKE